MDLRAGAARLAREESGATVLEFGFVAPILSVLLLGTLDAGHTLYMQAMLQGAMQKAARDAALESGSASAQQAALDANVQAQVQRLNSSATVSFTRRYYKTFSKAAAAQAESFTDTNGNGTCDAGEPYQDDNNNSVWDKDGGNSGQGGAKDMVVYTASVSYPRLFPLNKLIGLSNTVNLKATTVLENQPYGDQAQYGTPTVRNCP